MVEKIRKSEEDRNISKSGWTLKRVKYVELRVNKYDPLRAGSYLPLPKYIRNKKAIINVLNSDDRCFYYAIMSKLLPDNTTRYTPNRFEGIYCPYDFNNIKYPATLQDAVRFEKKNPMCSINVYSFVESSEGGQKREDNGKYLIYPLHVTNNETNDHTDLLFYSDGVQSHWAWIKNLSRLVRSQVSKSEDEKLFCKRCLSYVGKQGKTTSQKLLARHKELCYSKPLAGIVMPEPDDAFVEFKNYKHQIQVPVCIYADLEALLRRIRTCRPSEETSFTHPYQLHETVAIGAYVYVDDTMTEDVKTLYPNGVQLFQSVKSFIEFLQEMSTITIKLYSRNTTLDWTVEELRAFRRATDCYLCRKPFSDDKCADHDHITGKYRGAAHNKCNLSVRGLSYLPVFFHNLGGYDAHFLIRELGFDTEEITVIPNSAEKYISFSKSMGTIVRKAVTIPFRVRFVDSYRLVPSSLDKLARLLKPDQFVVTRREFPQNYELITQKGVFCYDYISDESVLDETCLPPKEAFYSQLTGQHISEEEYCHAQKVWRTFGCSTLRDYLTIYLRTDILIMADIFQNFRQVCKGAYGLDAAHYLTAPSLCWDAMLKFTGVRLELFTDYEMLMFVEASVRGGLALCSHRWAKANNKYIPGFEENVSPSYIIYLDVNNLYGYSMCEPLPKGGFEWVSDPNSITLETLQNLSEDVGYFLEVDVQVPWNLHDAHNQFPFLPESKVPPNGSQAKLMATLEEKKNYIVHYTALRQALEHGLVLTKVHRALKFNQTRWMAPYINLNTGRRAVATSDFEKDFWKLANNSVFGKSMENVRKRFNFHLVCDQERAQRYINRPSFKDRIIYSENLVGISLQKERMYFNRPSYVGASILDNAKTLNYQFHYDVLQPKYGNDRLQLLYQDTDSLVYSIQTDDLFDDFKEIADEYLDTSNYPSDHHSNLYSTLNKKVIGKWKDEMGGSLITEFYGLRAKMYAYQVLKNGQTDLQTEKRGKGIKREILNKQITFEDYRSVLRDGIELYHRQHFIRSHKHIVMTVEINKKTLSGQDDKRHIQTDGISTTAYGHYSLQKDDESMTIGDC